MLKIAGAYINQRLKRRRQSFLNESTKSTEFSRNMYINEKFLDVLKSSYGVSDIENMTNAKKLQIKAIEENLKNLIELSEDLSISSNKNFNDTVALALSCFNMGKLYADSMKAKMLNIGKNYFTKCLFLLKKKELDVAAISLVMNTYIQLDTIFAKLRIQEKRYLYINKALRLYLEYTKDEDEYPDPINLSDLFGLNVDKRFNSYYAKSFLEECLFCILARSEEMYRCTSAHKNSIYVKYVCEILNKKLVEFETVSVSSKDYRRWVDATLSLCPYFLYRKRISEARYLLAAATCIVRMARNLTFNKLDENDSKEEHLRSCQLLCATIDRYWGIYGIILLNMSKQMLLQNKIKKNAEQRSIENTEEGKEYVTKSMQKISVSESCKKENKSKTVDSLQESCKEENKLESIPEMQELLEEENNSESASKVQESCKEENKLEATCSVQESCKEENKLESIPEMEELCEEENNLESVPKVQESCEEENKSEVVCPVQESCKEENKSESVSKVQESCEEENKSEAVSEVQKSCKEENNSESVPEMQELCEKENNSESVPKVQELYKEENNLESISEIEIPKLSFVSIEKNIEHIILETKMTDTYAFNISDAKDIFLIALRKLNEARRCFANMEIVSYLGVVIDHSQLYKCLINFEENVENQLKMYKIRIEDMENVVKQFKLIDGENIENAIQYEKRKLLKKIYIEIAICKSHLLNIMAENLNLSQDDVISYKFRMEINPLVEDCVECLLLGLV